MDSWDQLDATGQSMIFMDHLRARLDPVQKALFGVERASVSEGDSP